MYAFGFVASTSAYETHAYLDKISEVPSHSMTGERVPSSGSLFGMDSMTSDSGHLWVAEHIAGTSESRVDEFDSSNGALLKQLPQLTEPNTLSDGIAVGHAGGEEVLYVGGRVGGEAAVATFAGSGAFLGTWTTASTGVWLPEISDIAVDDSISSANGDVYVALPFGPQAIDVFQPEANGKEKYLTQLSGVSPSQPFTHPRLVAVDNSSGHVIVFDESENRTGVIDVFAPGAIPGEYKFLYTIQGPPPGTSQFNAADRPSLAVDGGTGQIYLQAYDGSTKYVFEFESTGAFAGQVTAATTPTASFGEAPGAYSLAVDATSHHVFVGEVHYAKGEPNAIDVFGPNTVIPDVETAEATNVTASGATLNGAVNPDGEGEATCTFAWGETEELSQATPCERSIPNGEGFVSRSVSLTGLRPDTTYSYRMEASNNNGTNRGEAWQTRHFTTTGPGMHGESSFAVTSDSVTLQATIDPNSVPTCYHFEYGTDTTYSATDRTVGDVSIGSGTKDLDLRQHFQNLASGTTYHYRVVVISEVSPGISEVFYGADQMFTTEKASVASLLLDNRSWEIVSPANKYGALISRIGGKELIQAAADGNAIAYVAGSPTEAQPEGAPLLVQIESKRSATGWVSRDITPPHNGPTGAAPGIGGDYRFFSDDLRLAMVEALGPFMPLSPLATERSPYIRDEQLCDVEPAHCYEPLVTAAEGYADVPPGTKFGGDPNGYIGPVSFVDATPDLKHVILHSEVALTAGAEGGLYEWTAGARPAEKIQQINVLPNGEVAPGFVGEDNENTRGALSADGNRIFWSAGDGHLYMRDMARRETLRLDEPEAGATGAGVPSFQLATSDGLHVFFTDSGLVPGARGVELYECDIVEVANRLACKLMDLTGTAAEVQGGVLGASDDGNTIFFVANAALSSGVTPGDCSGSTNASATCTLYMLRRSGSAWEAPVAVATLSGEDYPDWAGNSEHGRNLAGMTSRVSSDGRWLAFMSDRRLTGYDNRDVNSGRPDEEVYLYNSATGDITCVSCSGTGGRPMGVEFRESSRLVEGEGVWRLGSWVAGSVPGWTPYKLNQALHQSSYLSDNGRLFFNSSDALVPQDANGSEDVYEYEPLGTGSCSAASSSYNSKLGGCVELVSSGAFIGESAFLDASLTGNDVFFLTGDKLVQEDKDTALDLYDAHVCDSQAPCAYSESSTQTCEDISGCRTTTPSLVTSVTGLSSLTVSGSGNVHMGTRSAHVRRRYRRHHRKHHRRHRTRRHRKHGGGR